MSENGSLDSGTLSNSLIEVDALIGLKKLETSLMIRGIRVEPLTKTTLWMLAVLSLEPQKTLAGSWVFPKRF